MEITKNTIHSCVKDATTMEKHIYTLNATAANLRQRAKVAQQKAEEWTKKKRDAEQEPEYQRSRLQRSQNNLRRVKKFFFWDYVFDDNDYFLCAWHFLRNYLILLVILFPFCVGLTFGLWGSLLNSPERENVLWIIFSHTSLFSPYS